VNETGEKEKSSGEETVVKAGWLLLSKPSGSANPLFVKPWR
jgi:hypothetical protein